MINRNKTVVAYYEGVHQYLITFEKPQGFREIKGALTAPIGTVWLYNGYGNFDVNEHGVRKRLQVLFVENLQRFKNTSFYKSSRFVKLDYVDYAMGLTAKSQTQEVTQCP